MVPPQLVAEYPFKITLVGPQLNARGEVAGVAHRAGGKTGTGPLGNPAADVFAGPVNSLRRVLAVGDTVSDSERFKSVIQPRRLAFSDADYIAFRAELQSGRTGILSGTAGDMKLLAVTGAPAPQTAQGVYFSDFLSAQMDLHQNDLGQVVFPARLAGTGVTSQNDIALYATDASGQLLLIAREGFPLNGMTINILNTLTSEFSNTSQFAFSAILSDGSSGIFIATVPEPAFASVINLLLAAFVGLRGDRRPR